MPQKSKKHQHHSTGDGLASVNHFGIQRSVVGEGGSSYHTELEPLKRFCNKEPNLEWLRKERGLIAINYARGLELWLVKARNTAFQHQELADTCGFMSLLNETEKEAAYHNQVTQELFCHASQPTEVRLPLKDESLDSCTIDTNDDIDVLTSGPPNPKGTIESPEKQQSNMGRKKAITRCFSFSKMFSRFRRSVSRRGQSPPERRPKRHPTFNERDRTNELTTYKSARKISLSEGHLNHYQMVPSREDFLVNESRQEKLPTRQVELDAKPNTNLVSPVMCSASPMHFSFSEIWPVENGPQPQQPFTQGDSFKENVEFLAEGHSTNESPAISSDLDCTSFEIPSLLQSPISFPSNRKATFNGKFDEDSDLKTLEMMSFRVPNHPEMEVELHLLLQTSSGDSDASTVKGSCDGNSSPFSYDDRSTELEGRCDIYSDGDSSSDLLSHEHTTPYRSYYSIYL